MGVTSEPALFGHDLFGDPVEPPSRGKMADDFYCPPFSVLNSREGWWQERKAAWIGLGIAGETGRDRALMGGSAFSNAWQTGHPECKSGQGVPTSGTSVFDPVLCELAYRWFCPPGGLVLDPFAGGSVRGIVAGMLGRRYHGIELRAEQVAANYDQAGSIDPEPSPTWDCGDCRDLLAAAPPADFVFTCPPYFDLERYSDDPRDLSAMGWDGFVAAYREAIAKSCSRLVPDRFAAIVVGDVRAKDGGYRDLPGVTIDAFRDAGLSLYNTAVLVTPAGSLPIRAGKQFTVSRKLGTTHQYLYVFVKGDPRRATAAIPLD